MALTLAVGFVVDDAIVMLENIVRHMEMGKPPMRGGARRRGGDRLHDLSMTLSLDGGVHPDLFLGGIVGRLFHEFAVTIAVAILVSGFVSLTLTPMLCSRFLRAARTTRSTAGSTASPSAAYDWLLGAYERTLDWAMRPSRADDGRSRSLILVGTVVLFMIVPKGFIPSEDTGQLSVTTEAAQGTSFDDMVAHQKQVADDRRRRTRTSHGFMSAVGGGGAIVGDRTRAACSSTSSRATSALGVDEIIKRAARRSSRRSRACVVYMQNPPAIQIGGRVSKSLYQFTLQSSDIATLYPAAQQARRRSARKSTLLQDVTSDLQLSNPQASVEIDRERAAALGVTAEQIETALYNAYGSRQVSTIYTPNNEYWVMMELAAAVPAGSVGARAALRALERPATLVPLSAVATITQTAGPADGQPLGPAAVGHAVVQPAAGRRRSATAIGRGAAARARRRCRRRSRPAFPGTAQAFQATQAGLLVLLVHRDLRDLRRARHALRELHPSAHDSLRPAVRRRSARCSRC